MSDYVPNCKMKLDIWYMTLPRILISILPLEAWFLRYLQMKSLLIKRKYDLNKNVFKNK